MRIPRWAHRIYAWAFRFYWLPCPDCGRMFGGHEHRRHPVNSLSETSMHVCPDCAKIITAYWASIYGGRATHSRSFLRHISGD